ncbi:MAG: UDP-N-acetylmuramoyl-L-alanyl-D-glutamate--2,6-diaminopimelate ligase [Alphaproteobacteria bacterium]|nr:UDP-N-acetylmuramoyl-L-alanyl-D-glutamate--2,6-diaminopimelate ligase [Alphaproteobacteria bacterium]MBP7759166.1 UDP-N-acetylmuramoyl-L-alanyl-D-glutamate--2,6-diaminopimelate ligase [Alphaproteobacteria bacterium]MBP7762636.1 UDP-N-acetylmuramoyl-L-alanyl-D-glutamate--2,6-diaminopimelate ligase [Alphaproteobacteria bacterium]MBP7905635.1 UDP-N-acetylmuramoyl-L-alanyl-D-glutamate--2,6-diaminopimelate ligase [Alphaproteobacteria bacterium]
MSSEIEKNLRETTHRVLSGTFAGITQDSREVKPGYIFAALQGTKVDGHDFIPQALEKGATGIIAKTGTALPENYKKRPPWNPSPEVCKRLGIEPYERPPHEEFGVSWSHYNKDSETPRPKSDMGILLIEADNPHKEFSKWCGTLYFHQPSTIAAVTGTNGKTSTAHFTAQLWQALSHNAASMGTLGIMKDGKIAASASMTTPDPVTLHKNLAEMAKEGITHLCMEASSHGLEQYRIDGVRIGVAGYTNISRDHLDYHKDMESYLAAKLRLFSEVLRKNSTVVLNADVPEYETLEKTCKDAGHTIISYGQKAETLKLIKSVPNPGGQLLELSIEGKKHTLKIPIVGGFQVMNALCALGLVWAEEKDKLDTLLKALENLQPVPGRLQKIEGPKEVYVDYAHTPDALETVLKALRPHTAGKLICLFGCGGDRDPGKRPIMGEIAARLADRMIVTDDNPRTEKPEPIRAAILNGIGKGKPVQDIGDRREAIQAAIKEMKDGDVLLVAGKGHETGQIIGNITTPFDDAQEVRNAMT